MFHVVCEELSRNGFRRLLRFQVRGAASFGTWLRVVVRRLCVDWHRKEFGRARVFESIARLSAMDHAVFEAVYMQGFPDDAAWLHVRTRFPHLTQEEFGDSCQRIRQFLTSRQLWLIAARQPKLEPLDAIMAAGEISLHDRIPDPAPDPEVLAAGKQQRAALDRALAGLAPPERLLIRLRFEQELTLEQIAHLTGLPNPQTADRRLKQILTELRKVIGKNRAASV